MKQFAITVVVLSLAALATLEADAQQTRQRRGYNPGPTITPYLDYARVPTGILDRFNQYVLPRRNLVNTLNDQERQIQDQNYRLQQSMEQVQVEIGQVQDRMQQIRQPRVRPTGSGASFMNYSQYFFSR